LGHRCAGPGDDGHLTVNRVPCHHYAASLRLELDFGLPFPFGLSLSLCGCPFPFPFPLPLTSALPVAFPFPFDSLADNGAIARSSFFSSLPSAERGSLSRNSIFAGTSYGARCWRQ